MKSSPAANVNGTIAEVLGPEFRLRVTATCRCATNITEAREQRRLIRSTMDKVARLLREAGVEMEFVVGQPRSPDMLRADLAELARASE